MIPYGDHAAASCFLRAIDAAAFCLFGCKSHDCDGHDAGVGTMAGESGWLKLYRKFLDSDVFQHPGMWHLFCWCMGRANHTDRKMLIPGTLTSIMVKRGSLITGRTSLHATLYPKKTDFSPSASTLWRWLQALEEMGSITITPMNNRCTMVTVCNFDTYQQRKDAIEQPMERACDEREQVVNQASTADGTSVDILKELKNESIQEGGEECPPFYDFENGLPTLRIIECPDGSRISWEENHLLWEHAFIRKWNKLPGVAQHKQTTLAAIEQRALVDRFKERDWDWRTAMMMFPTYREAMPLIDFLGKDMVQKINAGGMQPSGKAKQNGRPQIDNSGSTHKPDRIAAELARATPGTGF